jgi:hypothetical protein
VLLCNPEVCICFYQVVKCRKHCPIQSSQPFRPRRATRPLSLGRTLCNGLVKHTAGDV